MADITNIRGDFTSVDTMMARVRAEYPDAVDGIVIVFDKDGAMHTHHHASSQEMALAGARLLALAAR